MKRTISFSFGAGCLMILATGCYSTPGQQLARSKPASDASSASDPAWSRNFVPATFDGVSIRLNPNYQVVKMWRAETNSANRKVQVSYDVITDPYGRPVAMPGQ